MWFLCLFENFLTRIKKNILLHCEAKTIVWYCFVCEIILLGFLYALGFPLHVSTTSFFPFSHVHSGSVICSRFPTIVCPRNWGPEAWSRGYEGFLIEPHLPVNILNTFIFFFIYWFICKRATDPLHIPS